MMSPFLFLALSLVVRAITATGTGQDCKGYVKDTDCKSAYSKCLWVPPFLGAPSNIGTCLPYVDAISGACTSYEEDGWCLGNDGCIWIPQNYSTEKFSGHLGHCVEPVPLSSNTGGAAASSPKDSSSTQGGAPSPEDSSSTHAAAPSPEDSSSTQAAAPSSHDHTTKLSHAHRKTYGNPLYAVTGLLFTYIAIVL